MMAVAYPAFLSWSATVVSVNGRPSECNVGIRCVSASAKSREQQEGEGGRAGEAPLISVLEQIVGSDFPDFAETALACRYSGAKHPGHSNPVELPPGHQRSARPRANRAARVPARKNFAP